MTYRIQNTILLTQPSDGNWVQRQSLGTDGAGHPVYPAPREYQLTWDIIDAASYSQLQGFYDVAGNTGTVSVTLPQYASSTYQDHDYSGCVLQEPNYDKYFEQHYTGVKLLIANIRG